MRLLPRRITFQLTPLLDLLLIVIFAQYLDVRDRSVHEQKSQAAESSALRAELNEVKNDRKQLVADLSRSRAKLDKLDDELRRKRAEQTEEAKRLRRQRNLLAENFARLFKLPDDAVTKAVQPLTANNTARSKAELEKLRRRIEELKQSQPHEIVRHVVKFEELLKRCDVWEIHIDRKRIANVSIGRKSHQFRYSAAPLNLTGDEEADRAEQRRYFRELKKSFESKLFAYYKSLPQPKNIIIVLISRGPGTTAATYAAAKQGIQDTADHISAESGARIHVVYTDLGALRYTPFPKKS